MQMYQVHGHCDNTDENILFDIENEDENVDNFLENINSEIGNIANNDFSDEDSNMTKAKVTPLCATKVYKSAKSNELQTKSSSVRGRNLNDWATARKELAELQKEHLIKEFENREKRENQLFEKQVALIDLKIKKQELNIKHLNQCNSSLK